MVEVIEARWVLPIEPWEVIDDGAVAIDDGEIVAVGPAAQVAARSRRRHGSGCPNTSCCRGWSTRTPMRR